MGLLTVQLLFVEEDGDTVRLDVVVLARTETTASPAVGEPLCFAFAVPGDATWQAAIVRVLRRWADSMRIADVEVCSRQGETRVRFAVAGASVTLSPP